jgi:FecR protein
MLRAIYVLGFACVFGLVSPSWADSIGKIVAVTGSPISAGPGGNRSLSVGSEVFEHDKIIVAGATSNAQILFADGTKLVVGPDSSLTIEKYLLRGGGSAGKFSIDALRGTFRFITGKSAKSAYDIRTANATIGIRGTGFDFWVQDDTGVAVHEGKVKLCNRQHHNVCVNINAGCELGVAEATDSKLLKGELKVKNIVTKLPFVLDQRRLNSKFRLDVNACAKIIDQFANKQGTPHIPPPPQDNSDEGGDIIINPPCSQTIC